MSLSIWGALVLTAQRKSVRRDARNNAPHSCREIVIMLVPARWGRKENRTKPFNHCTWKQTTSEEKLAWTHVELEVIRPLTDEAVARGAGVGGVVLEDVVAPWCITILVKHHWSASTAWGKETRPNPTKKKKKRKSQSFTTAILFSHAWELSDWQCVSGIGYLSPSHLTQILQDTPQYS